MTKKDAIAKINELTGLNIKNGNRKLVIDNSIKIFPSEIKPKQDFYFIPVVHMGNYSDVKTEDVLYHDRYEVWKLPLTAIEHRNEDPAVVVEEQDTYTVYHFPLTHADMVYPVINKVDSVQNTANNNDKFSLKDHVAIKLRYPDADKDWINDMIRKSNELRGIPNPKL